jgi:hypothetical protein
MRAAKATSPLFFVQEDSVEEQTERQRGGNTSNRRNIVGLVVVILLAGLGWLLVHELQAKAKIEDCLLSGRRDCVPITDSN